MGDGRRPDSALLLDANHESNSEADRHITARLYGGDLETRIQQEIVLGIGGIRVLQALGKTPAVCHMNEGHSALLGLERTRLLMAEHGLAFDEARLPVAASTVFTTHTAVAAGINLFPPDLVRRHLAPYYEAVGLDDRGFLALGRIDAGNDHEPFSMALLGLRMSDWRNGVSQLHGDVSRRLWESAWPRLPLQQVPIHAVTNGVHLPTWVGPRMATLYGEHLGDDWRDRSRDAATWAPIATVPAHELWAARTASRHDLVEVVRDRLEHDALDHGRSRGDVVPLDPEALTIGFARRFAQYKRATLLFRDPDRLASILHRAGRPVQFLFAGKAHPRDEPAKQLIREVVAFTRRKEFRDRMVVLERYDTSLARSLVAGCDVWLNTPLRPLEASGTSGMKAVANGAIHVSILDGWWAEAYRPETGWAIGSTRIFADQAAQDANDADSLYSLLEGEITNAFYDRDAAGVPHGWVRKMRESVMDFAPFFNTDRMVGEYAERFYWPAVSSWQNLTSTGARESRELAEWLRRIQAHWSEVKLFATEDNLDWRDGQPARITVRLHPGTLRPVDLAVEVCLGHATQSGDLIPERLVRMRLEEQLEDGSCLYSTTLDRMPGGRRGYAVRVLPAHPRLTAAEDLGLVLWS